MQTSVYAAARGGSVGSGVGVPKRHRRALAGFGDQLKKSRRSLAASRNFCMSERSSCFGLRFDSVPMGIELGRVKTAVGSSVKSRSVYAQASTGWLASFDLFHYFISFSWKLLSSTNFSDFLVFLL